MSSIITFSSRPPLDPPLKKVPRVGGAKEKPGRDGLRVVCGACGQLGHMRTNKKCPLYMEDAEGNLQRHDSAAAEGLLERQGTKITIKKKKIEELQLIKPSNYNPVNTATAPVKFPALKIKIQPMADVSGSTLGNSECKVENSRAALAGEAGATPRPLLVGSKSSPPLKGIKLRVPKKNKKKKLKENLSSKKQLSKNLDSSNNQLIRTKGIDKDREAQLQAEREKDIEIEREREREKKQRASEEKEKGRIEKERNRDRDRDRDKVEREQGERERSKVKEKKKRDRQLERQRDKDQQERQLKVKADKEIEEQRRAEAERLNELREKKRQRIREEKERVERQKEEEERLLKEERFKQDRLEREEELRLVQEKLERERTAQERLETERKTREAEKRQQKSTEKALKEKERLRKEHEEKERISLTKKEEKLRGIKRQGEKLKFHEKLQPRVKEDSRGGRNVTRQPAAITKDKVRGSKKRVHGDLGSGPQRPTDLGSGAERLADPPKRQRTRGGGEVDLANMFESIINNLVKETVAYLFLKPVSKKEAPDYLEYVKKPMDLGTIREKARKMRYRCRDDFRTDVEQIVLNAHEYNDIRNPGIPPLAEALLELCDGELRSRKAALEDAEDALERFEDDEPYAPSSRGSPSLDRRRRQRAL